MKTFINICQNKIYFFSVRLISVGWQFIADTTIQPEEYNKVVVGAKIKMNNIREMNLELNLRYFIKGWNIVFQLPEGVFFEEPLSSPSKMNLGLWGVQ